MKDPADILALCLLVFFAGAVTGVLTYGCPTCEATALEPPAIPLDKAIVTDTGDTVTYRWVDAAGEMQRRTLRLCACCDGRFQSHGYQSGDAPEVEHDERRARK